MTSAQLDHLRLIDAHLARLLDIASKRTPGEWVAGWNMIGDGISKSICNAPMRNEQTTTLEWVSDKRFIASAVGNAEAGWRVTRAAIADWLSLYNETEGYADGAPDASVHDKLCNEVASICRISLQHILTTFPLKSLKP